MELPGTRHPRNHRRHGELVANRTGSDALPAPRPRLPAPRAAAVAPHLGVASGMIGAMIGRMHHVVLDCPDPGALAAFYSALFGLPVTYRSDDWVVVAASDTTSGLAFQ